jgi:hypothetical protein
VSLAPGVGWQLTEAVGLRASVELPVWRDLYGGPADLDVPVNGQSDADARWAISIEYGG